MRAALLEGAAADAEQEGDAAAAATLRAAADAAAAEAAAALSAAAADGNSSEGNSFEVGTGKELGGGKSGDGSDAAGGTSSNAAGPLKSALRKGQRARRSTQGDPTAAASAGGKSKAKKEGSEWDLPDGIDLDVPLMPSDRVPCIPDAFTPPPTPVTGVVPPPYNRSQVQFGTTAVVMDPLPSHEILQGRGLGPAGVPNEATAVRPNLALPGAGLPDKELSLAGGMGGVGVMGVSVAAQRAINQRVYPTGGCDAECEGMSGVCG